MKDPKLLPDRGPEALGCFPDAEDTIRTLDTLIHSQSKVQRSAQSAAAQRGSAAGRAAARQRGSAAARQRGMRGMRGMRGSAAARQK